jgi:ParB family transcriptional regulator, chromosome partitioning protein
VGKRVNLAELAREEVSDSYSPAPPSPRVQGSAPPDRLDRTVELDVSTLPVAEIAANPLNRRDAADETDEEFQQLVSTIQGHGVLQPIVVCSSAAFCDRYPDERVAVGAARWVALIGNRRLMAAAAAGQERVPAVVNDDRLASMYEVMLVENSHRKDLSPLHEAEAMSRVLAAEGISQRELAGRIGRTNVYVSQRIALLGLIAPLRAALNAGTLKVEQARQIGTLPPDEQQAIAEAGPPYRRRPVNGVNTSVPKAARRIAAGTPAQAAESIRRVFSPEELSELIRLLAGESD